MTILLLCVPGIIASVNYCRSKGIPMKSLEFFVYSIIFAFLINVFLFNLVYMRGHGNNQASELFNTIANVARSGIVGLIASFAIPNILLLLEKFQTGKIE